MTSVPIYFQRKIMYIPYVNILNLFIWVYNCICMKASFAVMPKAFVIVFLSFVPLVLIQAFVASIFPVFGYVLSYVNVYLIPLLISRGLIKYQEKIWGSAV